jgi:hypothetical protein
MAYRFSFILPLLITIASVSVLQGQTITNKNLLNRMSKDFKDREDKNFAKAKLFAKQKGWFIKKTTLNGGLISLIGVDEMGNPQYVSTFNNTIAAATTRANQLWPGGSSGLNLSGSSNSVKGKIAIWDGAHPLTTHVELVGRISLKDVASVDGHPTHTTGTLIATGINPIAKGMAFGAQQLLAYDYNNDASEMTAAAPNLLISNHSYGFLAGSGWTFDGTNWDWYGDSTISKTEAYGFGYYDENAQAYDSIAYNAPNYLISVAAGNARGYNGPAVDSPYFYNGNKKLKRSATLKDNPSYISVGNIGVSKNTLIVGAVDGIPAGYNSPNDVSIAYFSAWGPTNDGRIKPDVVADGVNVTSTWNTSTTAYSTQSGTSMACPNATGSLYLLQEYYNKLHPSTFMRSATLKGLAIHTADEAGPAAGPDYVYGWGLLDVLKGANVITSSFNQKSDTIIENSLNNASNYTYTFTASGNGPIVATLSWTDPPAIPVAVAQALHNTKAILVNDLDMRITSGVKSFMPWILDPANPANPATTGDNFRDNVEKINIDSVVVGQTYTITITHKGTLARGSQAFSLLVSGIGGQAYCTSSPTSSAGTRIDSVSISNINFANPPGCTTYTNNKNDIIQIQAKEKLPVRIKLSSCDASTAAKIVKIFIDYNNDGVFDPTTELAAQSGIINGNGIYTDTINIPQLTAGNTTLMRIVAEETSNASDVQPCGTYGNGETQDYTVQVTTPTNDLALAQVITPTSGTCSDDAELVVVSIRNNGIDTLSKVPVTAVISNSGGVVATLNEIYPGKIPPGFVVTYAFQKTFAATAGTTYNIKAYISSADDQNNSNDTLNSSVAIAAKPPTPVGTANVSGDTLRLKVTDPDPNANYFWYSNATGDSAIAASADTLLKINSLPADNNFYLGSGTEENIGIKSKNDYQSGTGGGYQTPGGNFMLYTSQVPLILKSAKLFIGNPGKVEMMVIDTFNTQTNGSYYYQILSDVVLDVYATSPTPKVGSVAGNNPADTGAVFYINLPLPAGKHVIWDSTIDATVDKSAIATASIFRNNNITGNPYPFTIPGVISITGNSATSATSPNQFQNYYYYLYDMKIETNDCISDRSLVAISGHINNSAGLNVWPNPTTTGQLNVSFNSSITGNFQIELFDLLGRRCYSQNYSTTGYFSTQINTANLITGMYILSLRQGSNLYKQKVLILR